MEVAQGAEEFTCEFDCGFKGSYDAVEAHESCCPLSGRQEAQAPEPKTVAAPAEKQADIQQLSTAEKSKAAVVKHSHTTQMTPASAEGTASKQPCKLPQAAVAAAPSKKQAVKEQQPRQPATAVAKKSAQLQAKQIPQRQGLAAKASPPMKNAAAQQRAQPSKEHILHCASTMASVGVPTSDVAKWVSSQGLETVQGQQQVLRDAIGSAPERVATATERVGKKKRRPSVAWDDEVLPVILKAPPVVKQKHKQLVDNATIAEVRRRRTSFLPRKMLELATQKRAAVAAAQTPPAADEVSREVKRRRRCSFVPRKFAELQRAKQEQQQQQASASAQKVAKPVGAGRPAASGKKSASAPAAAAPAPQESIQQTKQPTPPRALCKKPAAAPQIVAAAQALALRRRRCSWLPRKLAILAQEQLVIKKVAPTKVKDIIKKMPPVQDKNVIKKTAKKDTRQWLKEMGVVVSPKKDKIDFRMATIATKVKSLDAASGGRMVEAKKDKIDVRMTTTALKVMPFDAIIKTFDSAIPGLPSPARARGKRLMNTA